MPSSLLLKVGNNASTIFNLENKSYIVTMFRPPPDVFPHLSNEIHKTYGEQ